MGSQQVIQPNGQVHQLIESEGGVPAGQLPMDVLAQTATIVVDQGPVVPSHASVQGPEVQSELLCAPRPLSEEEQTFTHH